MFVCRQKIKFILHVFLDILQRSCKLIVLGTLGMPGNRNPKQYCQLQENFRVYLQAKNPFDPPPMLFWGYCKDIQTCYFGYFGHAQLHTPKMIASTCRRRRCLSASQKQTSSFTSFLRYYILKNWLTAFWLITREPEFCQIWDWW